MRARTTWRRAAGAVIGPIAIYRFGARPNNMDFASAYEFLEFILPPSPGFGGRVRFHPSSLISSPIAFIHVNAIKDEG
jgi:hypothetical protein